MQKEEAVFAQYNKFMFILGDTYAKLVMFVSQLPRAELVGELPSVSLQHSISFFLSHHEWLRLLFVYPNLYHTISIVPYKSVFTFSCSIFLKVSFGVLQGT